MNPWPYHGLAMAQALLAVYLAYSIQTLQMFTRIETHTCLLLSLSFNAHKPKTLPGVGARAGCGVWQNDTVYPLISRLYI